MQLRKTTRRSLAVVAVRAVAALAIAGCGDSSGNSSTVGAGAGANASASSGNSGSASQSQSSTSSSTASSASTSAAEGVTASSSGSGPPLCRAAGLALTFLGGQAATGHGELGFALKNVLGTSCNTIGYPGIQLISKSGAPIATHPIHATTDFFGSTELKELIVAPGGTVSFRLALSHGSGAGAGCATVYGLQVIPPNDTATLRVSIPNGALQCGDTTVSPMQPGSSAYP